MEPSPLPPHERTWRHPSELAAQERAALRAQAAAPSTRVFALTTGTLGLLAVGILILTVTPRQHEQPVAISASTTPLASGTAAASGPGPGRGANALAAPVVTVVATLPTATADVASHPPAPVQAALATPFGDGRHAIVTRTAAGQSADPLLDVRLPSGRVVAVEIVDASRDVVIVALTDAEPAHEIARDQPADDEIVTVMATPPITVEFADVTALHVDEGTAVLDQHGELVGLCTAGSDDDTTELIEVTHEDAGATSAGR